MLNTEVLGLDFGWDVLGNEVHRDFNVVEVRGVSMAVELATQGGFVFDEAKDSEREGD